MKIEITLDDTQDQDDLRHIRRCLPHLRQFVEQLEELFDRALSVPPPATVTMVITPIVEDAPCE